MRSVTPYERFGEPSPYADAFLTEHTFRAGDTLSHLAHRFYGDWRLWRIIADRNDIVDARSIDVGTVLLIPSQPLERGSYEST
jgi:nucleoid-associated protein YgaU